MRAYTMAEERLGGPPNVYQAFVIFDEHFHNEKINANAFMAITYSIFREDMLVADKGCYRFSAHSHEGFLTFSEYFRKCYGVQGGFKIISDGRIMAASEPTVNLSDLLTMLKSSDRGLLEASRWVWEGKNTKFLDGQPIG